MVLFFASKRSVSSRHCRDEINYAHNRDKQILVIDLEDVTYPAGLELSLSSTQAIKKYVLDQPQYLDKLLSVLPAETIDGTQASGSMVTSRSRRRWPKYALIAAVVLLAVVGGLLITDRDYWTARWLMFATEHLGNPIEQEIGFATASDDTRIAYATTGTGPPVLIVLGWATHLEQGMLSPAYDGAGVLALSSEEHTIIRYDGRGFGLSDRDVDDFSLNARLADLEAVVDALGLEQFALYAMSAGGPVGIAYASQHPDKVTRLVLASTNADFNYMDDDLRKRFESMFDVFETSWDAKSVRNLFLDTIFPTEGGGVEREIFSEFFERSASGHSIKGFLEKHIKLDVSEQAKQITVPTLVIHGRDDMTIPPEAGRRLASLVPNATFRMVDGGHAAGTGQELETRKIILDYIDGVSE